MNDIFVTVDSYCESLGHALARAEQITVGDWWVVRCNWHPRPFAVVSNVGVPVRTLILSELEILADSKRGVLP